MKTNSFWLNWLENSARFGEDPNIILDPAPMLARMTSANVKASAKKYLDPQRVYRSIMMPGVKTDDKKADPKAQPKR